MASIFTKIIQGEIPCHKIAENDSCIAFLDISPLQKGHTLIIPKREVDYIFDLEDSELAELMSFAKQVSKGIKSTFDCNRVGVTVIGLEVPHAHIHLIPINKESDMSLAQSKMQPSNDELAEIAEKIKSKL